MEMEFVLLVALIIVFVASFCGLLQKIRRSYQNETAIAERVHSSSAGRISLTDIYLNPTYPSNERNNDNSGISESVFPSAPPPYTELDCEPPPKYEDIFTEQLLRTARASHSDTDTSSTSGAGI